MTQLKLYHYDHCPYCIRVRMILGLKNIPYESIIIQNADEKSHYDLVWKKLVPILEYEDKKYMIESLDIVEYLDENYGDKILEKEEQEEIQTWLNSVWATTYQLVIPRFIKMWLEEFKTQKDIEYFKNKKEMFIWNFETRLQETPQLIKKMEKYLEELETQENFIAKNTYTYEDICLFPILRSLTCVKNLNFPPKVKSYLEKISRKSNVDLYSDRAF